MHRIQARRPVQRVMAPPLVPALPGGSCLVDAWLMHGSTTALVSALILAPVVSSRALEAPGAALRRYVPLLGALLARALSAFASACEGLRTERQVVFVLLHAALTYSCGDLLAQLAHRPAAAAHRPAAASGGARKHRRIAWRPYRTVRTSLVGVFSDAVPFFYWSSWLQSSITEHSSFIPLAIRSHASALKLFKVVLHVVVFQSASNALYLTLQALLRGDRLSEVLAVLGAPLLQTCAVSAVSFGLGGPLIFSLQSVMLQSALRNVGVLGFSVYLAMVANRGR